VRKRAANSCAVSPSDPLINVNQNVIQYVQFDGALAYGFSAPQQNDIKAALATI
jgi:hypothetical protein